MEDKKICRKSCISTIRCNKLQLKMLMTIKKSQDSGEIVSQTFLARELKVGLSTINYNVKELLQKGLIEQ